MPPVVPYAFLHLRSFARYNVLKFKNPYYLLCGSLPERCEACNESIIALLAQYLWKEYQVPMAAFLSSDRPITACFWKQKGIKPDAKSSQGALLFGKQNFVRNGKTL